MRNFGFETTFRMFKSRVSFKNLSLETLNVEVEELEDNTGYTSGSLSKAYWAHSLYAQFHDEIQIQDEMFPIKTEILKPFLLELSKFYPYRTLQNVYLSLRGAWAVISKMSILPPLPEAKIYFQ